MNKLLIFNKVETTFDFHSQVDSRILFQTIMTIANTHKDIVLKELVGFWQFPIDVKSCKCALSWWCKKKHKFLNIVLLAQHIFGIPINQIETKHIFSIVGISQHFVNVVYKQIFLDKLIFVNKNWPCDPRTSYLKPIDFVFACEVELNLKTKLEFEFQDEVDCKDFLNLNDIF